MALRMDLVGAVNDLIVGLYRYGRDVSIADFPKWALEQLREAIAFDSAAWGTFGSSTQGVSSVYLYGQPRTMLDEYVRGGWQAKDFLLAACLASPGTAINVADLMTPAALRRTALYRQFARRHRIEWALCTVRPETYSSAKAFISLWRSARDQPFTADERRRMQVLMPHLTEAMHANRLWQFNAAAVPAVRQGGLGMGVCDRNGDVIDCSRSFSRLIRSEWTQWSGTTLPAVLVDALGSGAFSGKRIDVEAQPVGDQWLLRVRAGGAAKRLGARERQVAALYASGKGYRDIAREVGVAPSTVRNQLRASFRKLGVVSKLELARRLGEIEQDHLH
jgi:DNA-binding CsgD family transcriptional regulator